MCTCNIYIYIYIYILHAHYPPRGSVHVIYMRNGTVSHINQLEAAKLLIGWEIEDLDKPIKIGLKPTRISWFNSERISEYYLFKVITKHFSACLITKGNWFKLNFIWFKPG